MERVSIQVGKSEPYELQQSEEQVSYLALDIGGSLIKIVYFSSRDNSNSYDQNERKVTSNRNLNYKALRGRLHFLKFETSKIDEWIGFISSKRIRDYGNQDDDDDAVPASDKKVIKATGGGAFKFADLFQEKFNIFLDKVDEMSCLVAGANFLLKAVPREAFTYMAGQKEYVQIDHEDLYPYLLVNIGSGVSMIKVDGDDKFERVSGTNVGGGTFWGLGKLLTQCKSFDELLELSKKGDNKVIDMLVGDIYGTDYSKIGLTSTAIASSFGKAISENKELEDYKSEDLTRSLLRMISNNIGQIAYLNALQFGLKRIFFGGFFTRGHAYTMDTISVAVHFWSKGEAKALFLRHEGFLGALGAFRSYETNWSTDVIHELADQHSPTVKSSSSGKESSCHENVQDYGCIDCSVQVRI